MDFLFYHEVKMDRRALQPSVKEGSNSNSEVVSDENCWWVGKKLLVKQIEIGLGGNGTVVYEGIYYGCPVAVKRLLRSHIKVNYNEIKLLRESQHHPNIVIYYGYEVERDFVYLLMERCYCDLVDVIQNGRSEKVKSILGDKLWPKSNGRLPPLLLKLMMDMISGLVHLHKLGIIHRDFKPKNILITKETSTSNLCAKVSDMSISRQLRVNKYTLSDHNTSCGTSGWTAPEKLTGKRQKCEMDIFSLGCVLFYCITGGGHPFGDPDERDRNIKDNNIKNLNLIQNLPEAFDLISSLLKNELEKRPKAVEVLCHPLFWDSKMRLSFLSDTSVQVGKNSVLSKALEDTAPTVLGTKRRLFGNKVLRWNKKVDDKIYVKGKYDFRSVRDLLQLIRNMFNNQILVRPSYEGIDDYFTSRFPMLLIQVYKVVDKYCKEEKHFIKYFTVAN